MNQTIISAVAFELNEDNPPYQAPSGFIWQKNPDEYDPKFDTIWEGDWNLVPAICYDKLNPGQKFLFDTFGENFFTTKRTTAFTTTTAFTKPANPANPAKHSEDKKYQEDLIKKQQKVITDTLDPSYHVCNHKTHMICTRSPCCDWFWHEGKCNFVSDDGECGIAVRYGNQ